MPQTASDVLIGELRKWGIDTVLGIADRAREII
jgi:hypothetical protein